MWELSMQALFASLMLGDASGVSGVEWKEDEGASLRVLQIPHSTH